MWARGTPPSTLATQHSTFGIMPWRMQPSPICLRASAIESCASRRPSRSRTPSTSVSSISFSARSERAIAPAASSALTL
jgi:hypothetical protein